MKRLIIPFSVLALIFVTNCAQILRRPQLSLDTITYQDIRKQVEQNSRKLQTLKGNATISIETPEMAVTAAAQIALRMPDSLFIKLRAGLGMGVGSIFIDNDRFTVYSPMQNTVYTGSGKSFNLNQVFQIDVNMSDLLDVISGIPTISEQARHTITINDNRYLVTIQKEHYSKKYWIDPKKLVITDIQIFDEQGTLFVRQEFHHFQKEKGVYLPKIIRIHYPEKNSRITLMYSDRATNKTIGHNEFMMKIPENAEKINL